MWLAIALGTRAPVRLLDEPLASLDEPLASLDPLARREFLGVVVAAARAHQLPTLVSSHVVTDAEVVCDRLLIVGTGRALLHADIAVILAEHAGGGGGGPPGPGPMGRQRRRAATAGEAWLVTPGELYPLAVGRQAAIGFAVGAAAIVLAFAVVDRHRPS